MRSEERAWARGSLGGFLSLTEAAPCGLGGGLGAGAYVGVPRLSSCMLGTLEPLGGPSKANATTHGDMPLNA